MPAVAVSAVTAYHSGIQQSLALGGAIRASEQLTLGSKAGGRITRLSVRGGGQVKAADVVAELERDSADNAVLRSRAHGLPARLADLGLIWRAQQVTCSAFGSAGIQAFKPTYSSRLPPLSQLVRASAAVVCLGAKFTCVWRAEGPAARALFMVYAGLAETTMAQIQGRPAFA